MIAFLAYVALAYILLIAVNTVQVMYHIWKESK